MVYEIVLDPAAIGTYLPYIIGLAGIGFGYYKSKQTNAVVNVIKEYSDTVTEIGKGRADGSLSDADYIAIGKEAVPFFDAVNELGYEVAQAALKKK